MAAAALEEAVNSKGLMSQEANSKLMAEQERLENESERETFKMPGQEEWLGWRCGFSGM